MKSTETKEDKARKQDKGLTKNVDQYITFAVIVGALLIIGIIILNIDLLW